MRGMKRSCRLHSPSSVQTAQYSMQYSLITVVILESRLRVQYALFHALPAATVARDRGGRDGRGA